MLRPKFNAAKELTEVGLYKSSEGLYGNAFVEFPKFNTPITPKENALMVLKEKNKPVWLPNLYQDFNVVQPMIVPDAAARVYGGLDWFGVEWIPQPELGQQWLIILKEERWIILNNGKTRFNGQI